MADIQNILSIDVESWVHFYDDALRLDRNLSSADRKFLDSNYSCLAIEQILKLLKKYNQKATFFVVAEIYDWYPEAIEAIIEAGHEIGYHTQSHPILYNSEILANELKQSADFIKRFKPAGFRAPNIYITRPAMSLLVQHGFTYSSSTYGDYMIQSIDGVAEIPVSAIPFWSNRKKDLLLPQNLSIKMLFQQMPFGSGLFIALFGSKISYFINHVNKKNKPAILFIHPWQMYQTKTIRGFSFVTKILRQNPLCLPYTINILNSVEELLKKHNFTSFKHYYEQQRVLE
ncbi:MAG: hypothetical protein A3H70_03820 [Candidatus Komeilibacteria bacterium RIFCSPLOWO2_02_FULL_48_11]|uniref:NodB homology domain-containing protein n=1 Tax=Candidatus Komeilibacteria bacterium RIFCSPLOWO2_02_FULL_48_11 TaxID=1798553 RepID=A0A1G2BNY9_9BACT|nr:MAG: hypothetical protein A3H70_03820 [Candidatus Komeilibacteria bacterium RIFCSPLOWO2_02_FULL_48_11]